MPGSGVSETRDTVPGQYGLFHQLALRRVGQCDIGRFEVAAGLQDDPVRAVLDKQDLGAADHQYASRAHGQCTGIFACQGGGRQVGSSGCRHEHLA
jgi:hypothetical protein